MRRFLAVAFPYFRAERAAPAARAAEAGPLAVVEAKGATVRVLDRNAAAERGGVRPGMTLAEARARLPELAIVPADPGADEAALARLGDWAIGFGPRVHLLPPGGVAVEVGGSAHLFGGERALVERAVAEAGARGLTARAAIAGTVAAALAVARHGEAVATVVPPGGDAGALGPLPVVALEVDARDVRRLRSLGVRTIADLLAFERADLRARFGEELPRRIAEALGEVEAPLAAHSREGRLRAELRFPEAVECGEAIAAGVARLAGELAGQLFARLAGVRRLALEIEGEDGTTRLEVGLMAPAREARLLIALLRTRLEGVRPAGRVAGMALEAIEEAPLPFAQMSLGGGGAGWREPAAGGAGLIRHAVPSQGGTALARVRAGVIDRLAARLGERAVLRAELLDDHRPERAFRYGPATRGGGACGPGGKAGEAPRCTPRPVRLFPVPQPIRLDLEPDGRPRGAVRGPERIEAAWWAEEGGEARDYYEVAAAHGRRLWVFRAGEGWFVHGIF